MNDYDRAGRHAVKLRPAVWHKGLEGFAVRESTFLRETRVETYQENLLRALPLRFPGAALGHLERRIQEQRDLDVLRSWFDLAMTASSLAAFEAGLTG